MKKLNLLPVLLIILLTAFAANAFAQAGHDTSKANNIVIDAKGGIYNHDGTKLGYITKDDIVKNNKGEKLYFIDRDGNVIDAKGNKLGMAKKNGNYYNNKGQTVLQLKNINDETCAILDPQGHNLGTVHKNYKLHACAAHCYFLEQKKLKDAKTKE
ncbi:DUF3659 domain-containing protein [Mucilaginibacter xinganensis]|uniref:DUF3659 domain-containing protein n=1 Tax=Mucilaginibacter xinganensis TaxID=1234841 RepID=A0A223NT71_9SPHI|nr:DUF3659 domain-containing protein [Mucilaginibacter xinganensis]ASU33095.1 hypothetical protein MuYL_1195 [Mucilaginibacter xinganensis]